MTLRDLLMKHEGLRLKPYKCTAGRLTIGIGRNLDDKGISEDEAQLMLKNDIEYFTYECKEHIINFEQLSEVRQWVLIDMCFNLGIGGLLKFKNMLSAIETNDFNTAADEMLNSAWAGQVGNRAIELAEMMMKG